MQTTLKYVAGCILLAIATAGCATTKPIETPSGRPECTIESASRDEIAEYIVSNFIEKGWLLQQQTDSQMVFWKDNPDTFQNALMGSNYDPTTTYEARLVLTEVQDDAVRVFGQVALLTNEGSAFEKRNDLSIRGPGYELWQSLMRLKNHFDGDGDEGEVADEEK